MEIFSVLLVVLLILLIPTAYAALIGAPYAPTFTPAVRRSLQAIKLGSSDTLVDLGCGDGKVLLEARRLGAAAIGYELSPIMWLISWVRLVVLPLRREGSGGRHKPRIFLRNFYRQSLAPETTVIFIFLMPDKMKRVYDYLSRQNLPNLRRILVYSFPFTNLEPSLVIHEPKCGKVYIYESSQFHN